MRGPTLPLTNLRREVTSAPCCSKSTQVFNAKTRRLIVPGRDGLENSTDRDKLYVPGPVYNTNCNYSMSVTDRTDGKLENIY